jgi:two-component system, NtrC family, response regulator HydG
MWDEDQVTAHHPGASPPDDPPQTFVLRIEAGPDRGRQIAVDGSSAVLVGQSPVCQLRLSDPTVSRRHASFESAGARLRMRDLGSRNGIYVGNVRVFDALLAVGDAVRLGSTTLVLAGSQPGAPALPTSTSFGGVLGVSREVRRLFTLFERLAATNIPVLVEGETGTGKEVLARALHDQGPRAGRPFVVFDCTAIASSLIEAELFGHEKGAFTGAHSTRQGLFEQAHGGTLFIDELGDMPLDLQPRLLRALEQSEVRRVGGDRWIRCDVRVIAATRRDVDQLVADGRFRDDLFHRLAVARVELPPLRQRKGDVAALVEHFCERLGTSVSVIPASLLAEWERRPWPGNLRELRNAVAREVALGDLSRVSAEPEGEPVPPPDPTNMDALLSLMLPYPEAQQRLVEAFRERYVAHMLAANGGNVARAAHASGIAPRYFRLLRARSRTAAPVKEDESE